MDSLGVKGEIIGLPNQCHKQRFTLFLPWVASHQPFIPSMAGFHLSGALPNFVPNP